MFTSIRKKITSKNPLYYDLMPLVLNHSSSSMEVSDGFWAKLFAPNSAMLNALIKCMSENSGQLAETISFMLIEDYKKSPTEKKAAFIIENCLEDAQDTFTDFDAPLDYSNPSIALNVNTEGKKYMANAKNSFESYQTLSRKKHQENKNLIYTRPSNFMFKEISEFIKREMLKSQIPLFIDYLTNNSGLTNNAHGVEIYEGAITFIKQISNQHAFGIAYSNLK